MTTKPEHPSRPKRLSAEKRRLVITDAAREEFARTGFAGTRVRAISDRAGVNEAMLYKHFDSKEALFEEAVAQPIEDAVNAIVERPWPQLPRESGNEVMRERTTVYFHDLLVAMSEVGPLLGVVLFADRESGTRYYRERLEPAFEKLAELTVRTLGRWSHREFDNALVHRIVFGVCWMVAVDERFGSDPPRAPEELAPQLAGILLDGIAEPGT